MSVTDQRVGDVLAGFRRLGSRQDREGMARFAITAERVFGVSLADIRTEAKRLGRDHALALALWDAGWRERPS